MARSRKSQPDPNDKHFADSNGEVQPRYVDASGHPLDPQLFNKTAPLDDDEQDHHGGTESTEDEADDFEDDSDGDELPPIMPNDFEGEALGQAVLDASTPDHLPSTLFNQAKTSGAPTHPTTHHHPGAPDTPSAAASAGSRKVAPVLMILGSRAQDDDVMRALATVNVATDRVKIIRHDEDLKDIATSTALPITVGGNCLWKFCSKQFPNAAFFTFCFERDGKEFLRVSLPRDEAGVSLDSARDRQREYPLARNAQPEFQRTGLEDVPAPILMIMQQIQAQTQLLTELVQRQQAPREPSPAEKIGLDIMNGTATLISQAVAQSTQQKVLANINGGHAPQTLSDHVKVIADNKRQADQAASDLRAALGLPAPSKEKNDEEFSFKEIISGIKDLANLSKAASGESPDLSVIAEGEAELKKLAEAG